MTTCCIVNWIIVPSSSSLYSDRHLVLDIGPPTTCHVCHYPFLTDTDVKREQMPNEYRNLRGGAAVVSSTCRRWTSTEKIFRLLASSSVPQSSSFLGAYRSPSSLFVDRKRQRDILSRLVGDLVATAIGTRLFFSLENCIGGSDLFVGVDTGNVVFIFFVAIVHRLWIIVWFFAIVAHDDVGSGSVASLE